MRKYIGKLVLGLLALLVCISVPLPIYAMTSEEKELLDMLGRIIQWMKTGILKPSR